MNRKTLQQRHSRTTNFLTIIVPSPVVEKRLKEA